MFSEAAELAPEERAAFLAHRCADNPQLRQRVEGLLAADEAGTSLLDRPDPAAWAEMIEDVANEIDPIGPYVLIREIGRGGMGRVYLAERADGQFEQQVAIKLIKRGMDTDAILQRFLRERQILARLQHPNIAQLTDGGVTDDGRPYFVMEHVDGQPITDHCDDRRLSIDARLALFEDVCRAVEHAHRNLVIHRDIKPSNILVTPEGHPKLLDFGVGKIMTGDEGGDAAAQTAAGGLAATPEYAAPEQLQGGPATTSTDVFGLGAVLFELLVGSRAFPASSSLEGRLRSGPDSTPTPSLDSAFRGDSSTATDDTARLRSESALKRSTSESRLLREFRGDLNVIVRKALRPEPDLRYASVEALREDVRRYRSHLPIRARQGDRRYRLARFARRHRVALATGTAFLALIVGAVAALSVQNVRIQSQAAEIAAERDRAEREATAARQVGSFLVDMFRLSEEAAERGDSVTARELLDGTRVRVDEELKGDPDAQARVLHSLSLAYENLFFREQTSETAKRAVEIRRELDGDPLLLAESLVRYGVSLTGVRDYEGADRALEEAIAIYENTGNALTSRHIEAVARYSRVPHEVGDPAAAKERADAVLSQFDPGVQYPRDVLEAWLGVLLAAGRWEDVAVIQRSLLAQLNEELGPGSPDAAVLLTGLLESSVRIGAAAAVDTFATAMVEAYSELDPEGMDHGSALWDAGRAYRTIGKVEEAEQAYAEALAIYVEQLGLEHFETRLLRTRIADLLLDANRPAEALPHLAAVVPAFSAERPPYAALPIIVMNHARALHGVGRFDEAGTQFRAALDQMLASFPAGYFLTAETRRRFARHLIDTGAPAEAEAQLSDALGAFVSRWGEANRRTEILRLDLARAVAAQGRVSEADSLLGALLERQVGQDSVDVDLVGCTRKVKQALSTPPVPPLVELCS